MKKIPSFLCPLIFVIAILTPTLVWGDEPEEKTPVANRVEKAFLKGEQYFRQGKYQEAIRAYQDLRCYYPNTDQAPKALFQIGRSYEYLKLYPEAEAIYQSFIEDYPENPLLPEAKLAQARVVIMLGKVEKAIDMLDKIIDQYSSPAITISAMTLLADCYFRIKDYQNAQRYYEMVSSSSFPEPSTHQQVLLQLGEVYLANKKYSKAREVLVKLINTYPLSIYNARALVLVGDSFCAQGDVYNGLKVYSNAALSYPQEEWGQWSRLRLANLGLKKDKDPRIEQEFNHPDYMNPLKTYEDIIQNSAYPELIKSALFSLGIQLYKLGNLEKAYSIFKQVTVEYPESKYYEEAQKYCKEVLQQYIASLYKERDFLAVVKFFLKNQDDIAKSSDARLLYQVASSWYKLGLEGVAIHFYKQAIDHASGDNQLALNIQLDLAEAYIEKGDYALTEETLHDFLVKYSGQDNSCRAYSLIVATYYHQKKFSHAIRSYLDTLDRCSQNKTSPYLQYLIGRSYQEIGNLSLATKYFDQAFQLLSEANKEIEEKVSLADILNLQLKNLFLAKRYKEAVKLGLKAGEVQEGKDIIPGILYQLGRSYQEQGLKSEAEEAFQKLLKQTSDPFWQGVAQVWLGIRRD
jgi:TolA-binding protein